jgi:hypothetical protein
MREPISESGQLTDSQPGSDLRLLDTVFQIEHTSCTQTQAQRNASDSGRLNEFGFIVSGSCAFSLSITRRRHFALPTGRSLRLKIAATGGLLMV